MCTGVSKRINLVLDPFFDLLDLLAWIQIHAHHSKAYEHLPMLLMFTMSGHMSQ